MKENITEIMDQLKIGQVIKFKNEEYVFIEAKRTRAVVCKRGSNKEYLIKGTVEITEEIDEDTVNRVEEEAIALYMLERKIRKMSKGQCFIGTDDKEYSYVKFNRSNLVCINLETNERYSAKPAFVKTILDKIIEQKK